MDFYINLKVNFRGNTKNFLLSGSETKSWESVEATVKRSFGLCSLQLTYFDEDNEEVSINSQVEYEEALKCAARQGNRLHMNVNETRVQPARVSTTKASGAEPKRGFRPPQHCPALAQLVSRKVQAAVPEQGIVMMKEMKGTKEEDKTPPAWFTSYMEKFKDQVVREAVENICREFSGQCCIHKPVGGGAAGGAGGAKAEAAGGAELRQIPEVSSTLPGAPSSSSTPPCSSCRGQTTGGGYQCSVCTSCTLCEPCSFSHDPSHHLVRARTPLSIPEHGSPAPDHSKFYRRGDRSFRKAEKQRLKAEKRLLKAEVKEIRKQLRMERRGIQWSSSHRDGSSSPILLQPRAAQHNSPERPKRPCALAVPTMAAAFLDENLPDGTRLRPGTKFIKYWKMRNTGTVSWTADTKLKFMWGNLAVGSGDRWREVPVPFLQPGQVGVVSVALCAPALEGSYTSHWRLAHAGEQFGPRVWCSVVVDPLAPAPMIADGILVSPCVTPQGKKPVAKVGKPCASSLEQPLMSVDQEENYIPSVDLLTAQDLLSFELLDINIVQELERVPNNSLAVAHPPAPGSTSPPSKTLKAEATSDCDPGSSNNTLQPLATLKTSLPPPPKPSRPAPASVTPTPGTNSTPAMIHEAFTDEIQHSHMESVTVGSAVKEGRHQQKEAKEKDGEEKGAGTRSRTSSTSSEDYIIILPDCFDTSRPLGESMYSSALSQPCDAPAKTPTHPNTPTSDPSDPPGSIAAAAAPAESELPEAGRGPGAPRVPSQGTDSANDMLCTSQTLDDEPLTPEVVAPANAAVTPSHQCNEGENAAAAAAAEATEEAEETDLYQTEDASGCGSAQREETGDAGEAAADPEDSRPSGSSSDPAQGARSAAASAYKALFTGQGPAQCPPDASSEGTMMAALVEMGFTDQSLNQRLLKKHNHNLLDVVNELVQLTDNDWYSMRY